MSRSPSSLSNLKKLARQKPDLGDVFVLPVYLKEVEDRAAAIIASSSLEHALEDAITSKMVSLTKSEYGELFMGDQPLASFSAKIKLAYALGLFGKPSRIELDTIRIIRNAFAHSRKPLWFNTDEVADACRRLTLPERTPNLSDYKGIEQPIDTPRKRFMAAVTLYDGALSRLHWPKLYEEFSEPAPLD